MHRPFTIAERIISFKYAINGIFIMLRSQHNAWIHALATFIVCICGFYCRIARQEWCWILLAIMGVWTSEALNTAFEFLADAASPNYHPLVKKAKDVSAGAVLIAAIGSAAIGVIILGPYIIRMFTA